MVWNLIKHFIYNFHGTGMIHLELINDTEFELVFKAGKTWSGKDNENPPRTIGPGETGRWSHCNEMWGIDAATSAWIFDLIDRSTDCFTGFSLIIFSEKHYLNDEQAMDAVSGMKSKNSTSNVSNGFRCTMTQGIHSRIDIRKERGLQDLPFCPGIFTHDKEDSEAAVLETLANSRPVHSVAAQRQVQSHGSLKVYFSEVQLAQKDGKFVELGAGGWGKVYKGRLRGKDCAVKLITDMSEHAQARFLMEIKLLGTFQSEHITKCLGWSVCPKGLVLLMELMPGGDLGRALREPSSIYQYRGRGKEVMSSVARAVMYLHEREVCHFDIKPGNILLTGDGKAKLADVGLSKAVTGDAMQLSRLGTLVYASPEQRNGVGGLPADIWAFGTTLWEVCTREWPAINPLASIDIRREAPQEVVDLINRCRAVAPQARPSAEEVYDALSACPQQVIDSIQ